jgi:hypothetical protein
MKAYWKYDYETRHAIIEALEAAEMRLNRATRLAIGTGFLATEYQHAHDLVQLALDKIDESDDHASFE